MNRLLSILFLFSAVIFTSCLKDNEPTPNVPVAALRIVNSYTHSESIGLSVDHNYITSIYNPILYNTYTKDFTILYPGNRRFRVYNSSNQTVFDKLVNIEDSTYYTSFVYGNTAEAKNLILKDTIVKDLGQKAAFRFLHLASNIEKVNVYFNNTETPIYEDRGPEVDTETNTSTLAKFIGQTSGKHKVIITDDQNNIIVEREYEFKPGKYYSLILSGDKNSTSKPPYLGIITSFE